MKNPQPLALQKVGEWRRRESNACPHGRNQDESQQLASALDVLGGNGEDGEFTDCHRMAGIDATLWGIIKVWRTLPELLRKEVEAICLQPASRDK